MAGREVEWEQVQGIVLSGYGDKPLTRYYLLEIIDAAAARVWLRRRLSGASNGSDRRLNGELISFGGNRTEADVSVNIAFTFAGLAALGLPKDALDTFPWDFRDGMASPLRRRILHDFGPNDPDRWRWGFDPLTSSDPRLHVLVMMNATKDAFASRARAIERGWRKAFTVRQKLADGYRPKDSREHFGFVDALSQPAIDTSPLAQKLREQGNVNDIIQPGEFILGYVNERGQLPLSPSIAAVPGSLLPLITNADRSVSGYPPNTMFPRLDFGRNGTFLVYRQLRQNVVAFADLIKNAVDTLGSKTPRLNDEEQLPRLLAAKIMGRWDDGASLTLAPNCPPSVRSNLSDVNNFGYAAEDRYGLRCPIGAHVRRANPRDTLDDRPEEAIRLNKRHRLLRRGRIYGKRTFPDAGDRKRPALRKSGWYVWDIDKQKPKINEKRGLHFLAINASIESQFEFVQQTWMNTPFFGGLTDELDPLIGIDSDGNHPRFTMQGAPINRRFSLGEPLVTVRGGAYFFLPGRAALEFLANEELMAVIQPERPDNPSSPGY